MTRDTEGNAIDLDELDDAIWKEGNDQTWFEPGSYRTPQRTDRRNKGRKQPRVTLPE